MAKPRCGVKDIDGNAFFGYVSKWEKTSLTYKFVNYGEQPNTVYYLRFELLSFGLKFLRSLQGCNNTNFYVH